ncbi:MAG: hypothetical protein HYR56_01430 [Acidobacteria bacterium]|nr:hypothetical protein [Acidobacteriota bacterium]MBI3427109.1 hypothetical protein [Acidobacteriota bacterium]
MTIEIPDAEARQLETILDDCMVLMDRMEAERPQRELESEQHNRRFREGMDRIWATLAQIEARQERESEETERQLLLVRRENLRLRQKLGIADGTEVK